MTRWIFCIAVVLGVAAGMVVCVIVMVDSLYVCVECSVLVQIAVDGIVTIRLLGKVYRL
jgi:hypothetical protein